MLILFCFFNLTPTLSKGEGACPLLTLTDFILEVAFSHLTPTLSKGEEA